MVKKIIAWIITVIFILIFILTMVCSAFAGDNAGDSETGYRVKPLLDKLARMKPENIEANVNKFPDMKKHWSRTVVGKLTGLEIIAGVNGKFLPDSPVQADQFITMTVRIMGFTPGSGTKYWAQPYIDTAISEGIVLKGEFTDYKQPLSREQMARIIVRATLKMDANPGSKYDRYIIGKVKDYPAVSDNCKQYVIDAYKLGLVTGANGNFRPKSSLTRAEASVVILRFLDKADRKPMAPGAGEVLKLVDNKYNPTEIYPGSIPETFYVAKAAQDAIPKAKGYVDFFYNPNNGMVLAWLYKDKESHDQSVLNMIASIEIAYNSKDVQEAAAYCIWVNDSITYKQLFIEFTNQLFRTIFGNDAEKAIALNTKYMNMKYTRTDGLNQAETVKFNNRSTDYIRYNDVQFSVQIQLIGKK